MDLNVIWFILIGFLFAGYALLDGFDLGVGGLHLFTKSDKERRIMLNAIGPVWDGNEVWLVTGGGALFAAFPIVYATVFSGFYLAFMLLLLLLIFRAISIEFRSKQPMKWWRSMWDVAFSVSSVLSGFVIGVALGNLVWGIPLGADGEFQGSFLSLFHPYSLMTGIMTVALFMMHGSIYIVLKTEGDLHNRVREWVRNTIIFFIISYVVVTMLTLLYVPHMAQPLKDHPILFSIPLINLLAIANIPREIFFGRDGRAFLSSCVAILALMALFAIGLFPNLVISHPYPEYSLTIWNASSTTKTLKIMLTMALIGMPIVLAYTVSIYWIFRGKVKLEPMGY
ncbi:cytochrome d ubiquinol oxidase subunit II [bacterium F11]|nr:cytochrome d ubiquinol oxidase subunit II [bacterium F11]